MHVEIRSESVYSDLLEIKIENFKSALTSAKHRFKY